MGESTSNFRDTLLELIDASPEPMDHPSPDHWIAYHRGELSAGEEARLQEHLTRCRDCFDLAAGAAAFAQPDEEPDAGQEMETAALWRLLRPQLDPAPAPSPENVREISARPRPQASWRFRLPTNLAALFFVALVGLSTWSYHQHSLLETALAPKPNPAIVDFLADERLAVLPAAAEKTLATSTGPWMLMFHPDGELPAYWLTLRDAATHRELWSYKLLPDEFRTLKIQLPEGLRPGRYRLELSDREKAGKILETRLLRVTEPGRGD